MSTDTTTIAAGTRGAPVFAPAGSLVSVTPATGATALVEYTRGTAQDIANNVATWTAWPNGACIASQSNKTQNDVYVRVTATNGVVSLGITDSANVPASSDWQTPFRGRPVTRILTRSLTGRANTVLASSNSFGTGAGLAVGLCQHQRVVLAGHFDAVRIAIPNMHTASISNVLASVGVSNALGAWAGSPPTANNTGQNTAASPAPTETVSSAGTGVWRALTFNSAASATLPAATDAANLIPSWTWSDWAPIFSVDRVDGGTLPVLDVRFFIPTAAGSMTLAWTGASNNAWAVAGRDDLFTAGRAYRVWNQDVDGVTTPASFTTVLTQPMMVPILIQYRAREYGACVVSMGDSIWEGTAGTTYPSNNFIWQAVTRMSSPAFPVEYCSINAAGATSLQLIRRAQAIMPQLSPSVLFAQPASINNFGTTLGARTQQEGQGAAGVYQQVASNLNCSLILGSMFPVTNAARAWGVTDSQRVTLNGTLRNLAADNGYTWCDFGGAVDGQPISGQVEPLPALISGDGFHFNDAGQTAMSNPAAAAITAALTGS